MGGLQWTLDGESTRAFGVGLVGNSTSGPAPSSSSSSGSASASGSATSSSSMSASASASDAASSASETPNAAAPQMAKFHLGSITGAAAVSLALLGGAITLL